MLISSCKTILSLVDTLHHIFDFIEILRYAPFATNLVVADVHPTMLVNGVICQVHIHIRNIVTSRFLVFARRKPENAIFLTFS